MLSSSFCEMQLDLLHLTSSFTPSDISQCIVNIDGLKVTYLVRDWIKLPEELTHGDGLGIHGAIHHPLLIVVTSLMHEGQGVSQHMQDYGFACKRLSNKHEPEEIKKKETVPQ